MNKKMKTIKEIDEEINSVTKKILASESEGNKSSVKAYDFRLNYLKKIKLTLEQFTESGLKKQYQEAVNKVELLNSRYDYWYKNTPGLNNIKNPKTEYEKLNNINALKSQISFLKDVLEIK